MDLPDDHREAAVGAITLQENFDDFDANFNDFEMDTIDATKFAINQSRPEEITIKEDVGPINFITDDGFGTCYCPTWLTGLPLSFHHTQLSTLSQSALSFRPFFSPSLYALL